MLYAESRRSHFPAIDNCLCSFIIYDALTRCAVISVASHSARLKPCHGPVPGSERLSRLRNEPRRRSQLGAAVSIGTLQPVKQARHVRVPVWPVSKCFGIQQSRRHPAQPVVTACQRLTLRQMVSTTEKLDSIPFVLLTKRRPAICSTSDSSTDSMKCRPTFAEQPAEVVLPAHQHLCRQQGNCTPRSVVTVVSSRASF